MIPGLMLRPSENDIEPCTNQYKLRPGTIYHTTATVSVISMFCALAIMVYNTDPSDSNTED